MKYNHKFTCQILFLDRNKGRNGLHFGHFGGRKKALYFQSASAPFIDAAIIRPVIHRNAFGLSIADSEHRVKWLDHWFDERSCFATH
jgi:hypothetical protein